MINDDFRENLICELEEMENDLDQISNEEEIEKPKIYICLFPPHDIPTFKIIYNDNNYSLQISCSCKRKEIMTFKDAFDLLLQEYKKIINYDDYYKCSRRNHEGNNYKYYCEICNTNLCELCMKKFKTCPHRDLFDMYQSYSQYLKEGESILNKLNTYVNIDPYIPKLFGIIYDNFKELKTNYSYFDIIKQYNKFIKQNKFEQK